MRKHRIPRSLLVLLVLFASVSALSACATTPQSFGQRTDVDPWYYIAMGANEEPDFAPGESFPDFSSVVALWEVSEEWALASAVLVHEDWVLTAAHNVLDLDEYGDVTSTEAHELSIRFGANASEPEHEVAVAEIFIHPEWELGVYEGNFDELYNLGVDIALLRLEEPVRSVEPARLNFTEEEPIGLHIVGSGYGDYGGVLDDGYEHWSLRTGWENILDRVVIEVSTDSGLDGGFLIYDFDSADGDSTTYGMANTLGTEFDSSDPETSELLELVGPGDSDSEPLPLEGTAVPGDSGGPIFARLDGEWHVIGVVAFGSTIGYYGDIGFNTRTASHAWWLLEITDGVLAPELYFE